MARLLLVIVFRANRSLVSRNFGQLLDFGARAGNRRPRPSCMAINCIFIPFFGINKQPDLQTALTEAGRYPAHYQGWYDQRQVVQLAFIALIAVISLFVQSYCLFG
jgi:hypothetical protein